MSTDRARRGIGGGGRDAAPAYDPVAARKAILETVARIPRGCVASYSQVAFIAGWPGRARLVGRVLSELFGSERLPWHRVISASGRIALPLDHPSHAEQRRRLEREGVVFLNGRASFRQQGWQPMTQASPLLD